MTVRDYSEFSLTRKMAAIDQFDFLLREIFHVFGDFRDALAVVGSLYALRKTYRVIYKVCGCFNEHLFCRLSRQCDLSQKFGTWAGGFSKVKPKVRSYVLARVFS